MDAPAAVNLQGCVALCKPSSESLKSDYKKRAAYSHLLYCSPEKKEAILISEHEIHITPISKFSSCSTTPNSSCESLNNLSTLSRRHSRASTAITTPLSRPTSSKSASSRSSAYSRYADDCYPLITTILNARTDTVVHMAHAYNTYIRALNSCYNHAAIVSPKQVSDFLLFNQTLFNILSLHLKLEQQHILPLLHSPIQHPQPPVQSAISITTNQIFNTAFHSWATYIHDPTTSSNFSANHIQAQISIFAPLIVQHLHNQITNLNDLVLPKNLLPRTWTQFTTAISANLDLHTDAALLIGCHDKEFTINGSLRAEQEFPRLSAVMGVVVRKWYSRRYGGAWRFCSSDFCGRRRLINT